MEEEEDKPLEQRINETVGFIENGVEKSILGNKPFSYLVGLAITGDNEYGVDREKSFFFGVDRALDYYNHFKTKSERDAKFDGLVHGSKAILRYIYTQVQNSGQNDDYE